MEYNENDLRVIKPIRIFDEFRKADVFLIPCIIKEITENRDGNKREIKIEIINFNTGKLSVIPAITYEKSLGLIEFCQIPLKTLCKVIKNNYTNKIDYIVWGLYNTGEILNYINNVNLNLTEDESMSLFKENYFEINNWLKNKL